MRVAILATPGGISSVVVVATVNATSPLIGDTDVVGGAKHTAKVENAVSLWCVHPQFNN